MKPPFASGYGAPEIDFLSLRVDLLLPRQGGKLCINLCSVAAHFELSGIRTAEAVWEFSLGVLLG